MIILLAVLNGPILFMPLPTAHANPDIAVAYAAGESFETNVCVTTGEIDGAPDLTYNDCSKGDDVYATDYNTTALIGQTIEQVYANITYYGTVSGTLSWYYNSTAAGLTFTPMPPVFLTEGGSAGSPLTETYNLTSIRGTWTINDINNTEIQFFNNDGGGPESAYVDALYLTIVYSAPAPNNDPVNEFSDIDDMDDTNNVYSQKTNYTLRYNVSDLDGFADIDYAEIRIKQGAATRAIFRYDEDTNTFTIQSGATEFDLDTDGSTASESGNFINMTFLFSPQFDATEESALELEGYVLDDAPASDTDTLQTNYFDIVTDLLTTFTLDDDRGDVSATVTGSGNIRYADDPGSASQSTSYPPDSEFTSASIYNSTNDNLGTDNTIVNGAWSIPFTAEDSPGLETYNLYIDMADSDYTDGEETPTDTFIADQCQATSLVSADSRINLTDTGEVRLQGELAYDAHALGSGDTITINGNNTVWDAGNSWFENITQSSAVVQTRTYNSMTCSEATYGISAVDMNGQSTTITWERLSISFVVDDNTPDNAQTVTFTMIATFQSDSTNATNYIHDIYRNITIFKDDYATKTFTDQNSDLTYIYNFTFIKDQTFGITAFVDPSDITVTWAGGGLSATSISLDRNPPGDLYMAQTFRFTITLTSGGSPVPSEPVILQRSEDNSTWTNILSIVTDNTGISEAYWGNPEAAIWYFRSIYNEGLVYDNSTSNSIQIDFKVKSQLSLIRPSVLEEEIIILAPAPVLLGILSAGTIAGVFLIIRNHRRNKKLKFG